MKQLLTFAFLLAIVLPAVWTLLALSDRWLGNGAPRALRGYHFRSQSQRVRRAEAAGAARGVAARFWLIRTDTKPRTKRPA